MLESIGLTLPQAVGIAVSPLPIIAVIIMLMSPKSKRTGVLFMVGWLLGILATTTIFSFATRAAVGADAQDASQPILGWIKIGLGVILALLALRNWRKRPKPGEEPEMPKWMSQIDRLNPWTSFVISLGMAAFNPKNLIMAAAAGTVIGASRSVVGDSIWVIVIFTVIAASTVAGPVLAALFAPKASASALTTTRTWLVANNATIMTVMFVVLSVQNLGDGIAYF